MCISDPFVQMSEGAVSYTHLKIGALAALEDIVMLSPAMLLRAIGGLTPDTK